MKTKLLLFIIVSLLLTAVLPVFADYEAVSVPGFGDREPVWPSINGGQGNNAPSAQAAPQLFPPSAAAVEETELFAPAQPVAEKETGGEEEMLLFTNFNNDPVKNKPTHYFPLENSSGTVLVTKIRTYHWNNGNGAMPGTISIYDTDTNEKICGGSAVGRSGHGTSNVYWEALTECLLYPGHTYRVKVSDPDTWSYNDGSNGAGMFELYGYQSVPEGYVPGSQGSSPVPSMPQETGAASYAAPVKKAPPVPQELRVGATFEMGTYEMNNNRDDGPETIDWIVLAVQNDRALVISELVLDYRFFTDNTYNIRWDTSLIRKWLNGDFYNTAFTPEEKSRILLVNNENPNNVFYGTYGGPDTQDNIFLLSYDEANRYFRTDKDRMGQRSKYAGSKVNFGTRAETYTVPWTLRSPGFADNVTGLVGNDGVIDYRGTPNIMNGTPTLFAVRPALWLKVKPSQTGYRVKYNGNNCLAQVPTDNNLYQPGDLVTVLFEPVEYMQSLIFNGWDADGDGVADHGYYYNTFIMPARDVELKAICYTQYQDHHYNNYGITTGPVGQDYSVIPDPGFVPNHTDPLWMDGVG